ncbi:hypothetical protein AgCh_033335 [Apium graveolens]
MLKNKNATVIASLNSTHLCFLNSTHRHLSENVSSKLTCIKALFENYGFTDTQVSKLLEKYPFMLSLNVDRAKAKLDFLHSYGFKSRDLCQILAANGYVMRRSLDAYIKPSCEILKGLLKDCKSVIVLVKKHPRVMKYDLSKAVVPNIELLRHYGVPNSRILAMLKQQPTSLLNSANRFKIIVREIREMGFDPGKSPFLGAINVWSGLSKETRERKWDLFRMWGWSDDEILLAFKKQPTMMMTAEEKIQRVMDFLVNKMGWNASEVASYPNAIMHSFEKWTMPRCLVVQFLLSKGVLKDLTLRSFIKLRGDKFRKQYVDRFCVKFPQVLNLYGVTEDNRLKLQLQFLHRGGNSSYLSKKVSFELTSKNSSNLSEKLSSKLTSKNSSNISVDVSSKLTSIKGLFENYGFTDTQFSKLFDKHPSIVSLNIGKVKPKLDYLHSFGFTSNDLCEMLEADLRILQRGLKNRIIPSCELLKSFLKDNVSVVVAVKRYLRVFSYDISKTLIPNFNLLLNLGVPEYRILVLLRDQTGNLIQPTEKFKAIIDETKELGLDPEKRSFFDAVRLFYSLRKSTRERKWELFRKWGWSDEEILSAVRKQPFMMTASEEKIERVMDFLVNKIGWSISQISYRPLVIMHSLEKWTMPRCLVVKFLLSKGVLKNNLTLSSFIVLSEENFKKRFVDEFCVNFPEVITLYGGA